MAKATIKNINNPIDRITRAVRALIILSDLPLSCIKRQKASPRLKTIARRAATMMSLIGFKKAISVGLFDPLV